MNRGVDHGRVFFDDSDRIEMGSRFADIHDRFGVVVLAYCLMDNHYHCVLQCPNGGLSEAMQRLGSLYTRHVNDRLGRDGPLFRGRFASRQIADGPYLLAACRYVHRNPLVIEGIDDPADYRWSSHRTYLGLRPTPPWLRQQPALRVAMGRAAELTTCGSRVGSDPWRDQRAARAAS
jgi:REP element-mobilizing transposase RayT